MSPVDAWFMTSGETGHRTQARGLAEAVAGQARELTLDLRAPWRYLPGDLTPFALNVLTPDSDRPAPPWPELLISSGRRVAAAAIAIRRASRGRTLAVHVQDPQTRPSAFDLVVSLGHDAVSGPNVLSLPTAAHDLTPAKLSAAGDLWRARLRRPGQPLIGVLLGGAAHRRSLSLDQMDALFAGLDELRRATGARLAITPSRRTSAGVRARLAARFASDPDVFVWDLEGENPYRGILALSDRLVVTSDSVSMVSEALATNASVEIFGRPGSPRHGLFIDRLVAKGQVRPFTADPVAAPPGGPINATDLAAAAVRRLLTARRNRSSQG